MHKVFCAIDTPDLSRAIQLAKTIAPITGAIKLGLEFWASHGINGVNEIKSVIGDAQLFLDLKFHDIPNTVSGAVKATVSQIEPDYLTIHTSGGADMMKAAVNAARGSRTKILGVSVLTSLNSDALLEVGQGGNTNEQVLRLALLAKRCGLAGAVCSASEISLLREEIGNEFELMVPGIRPIGSNTDDQSRTATPQQAIKDGATHLVVGRPITNADNPVAAARDIVESIK